MAIPGMIDLDTGAAGKPAPAKHQQGKPRAYQGGGAPAKDRPEKQQVIRMQTIMSALATAMSQNKAAMADRFGVDEAGIERISGAIGDTGGRQTFDGLWGPKTIAGLNEIAAIAEKMGTSKVNPGKHYREVKNPENIIAAAKANVDAIAELMRQVGLKGAIPGDVGARPEYYDVVPEVLNRGNLGSRVNRGEAGVAVRPSHLDTIWAFYRLLNKDIYADLAILSEASYESDLEKYAEQIKNSTVVREFQVKVAQVSEDEALNQRGDANLQERAQDDGFDEALDKAMKDQEATRGYKGQASEAVTVAKFDAVLKWFVKRTNMMYRAFEDDYYSGATTQDADGKVVPLATKQDVENAKSYYDAIVNLADTWDVQRGKFLEEGQDPKEAVVDPSKLQMYRDLNRRRGQGQRGGQGGRGGDEQGRTRRYEGGSGGGSEGFSLVRNYPNGPIQRHMKLQDMSGDIPMSDAVNWLRENAHNLSIERESFRTGSPSIINRKYNRTGKNPRGFVITLVEKIGDVLSDIYKAWQAEISRMPSDEARRLDDKQMRQLDDWHRALEAAMYKARDWNVARTSKPRPQQGTPEVEVQPRPNREEIQPAQTGPGRRAERIEEQIRHRQQKAEEKKRLDLARYNREKFKAYERAGRADEYRPSTSVPANWR